MYTLSGRSCPLNAILVTYWMFATAMRINGKAGHISGRTGLVDPSELEGPDYFCLVTESNDYFMVRNAVKY